MLHQMNFVSMWMQRDCRLKEREENSTPNRRKIEGGKRVERKGDNEGYVFAAHGMHSDAP